jgi:alanine racemase
MKKIVQRCKSLAPKPKHALNTIYIHAAAILHNLRFLQQQCPHQAIFPVLKSNAYGHGLFQIASILKHTNVPYLCVDSYPEYQIVRQYAHKKCLILGETIADNYSYYDPKRATPAVYTLATLQALINSKKQWTIHLFLNTGMHREGIQEADLEEFLQLLVQHKHISLE